MHSSSSFVRYVLVAVVSAFVAMALAAPAVTAHNDGFKERILACFDSRDPDSDQCRAALDVSPVDADFFTRLAANLGTPHTKPEPKPEPKPELWTLVRACAETRDLDSEECARAIETSGLSLEDFKAKFAAKLGCVSTRNHDVVDPCAKKSESYDVTSTIKDCLALRATVTGMSASDLMAKAEKVNTVCGKALSESRLTAAQFWSKYR